MTRQPATGVVKVRSAFAVAATVLLVLAGAAHAAEPNQFVLAGHFGWKVDRTTGASACFVASGDECGPGEESGEPVGFSVPEGIAGAPNGNVYVADKVNHRIQELGPQGEFVLMFGWNVNKTKQTERAEEEAKSEPVTISQDEENFCTAVEVGKGIVCQAGEESEEGRPGQMLANQSVAVDPITHHVFVLNRRFHRVDEFTEEGAFVLMIGQEVNETKTKEKEEGASISEEEENVCSEASGNKCRSGVQSAPESLAPGALKSTPGQGDLLAVGGPDDRLYIGDEGRVQVFEKGKFVENIELPSLSTQTLAVAVDGAGDVFVSDEAQSGVSEYLAGGGVRAERIDPSATVMALAMDAYGRIGLLEQTEQNGSVIEQGALYVASGAEFGMRIRGFGLSANERTTSIAFDTQVPPASFSDRLYVIEVATDEVEALEPVVYPLARVCEPNGVSATSATLCGEVDPSGLTTTGSFEYGTEERTLGSTTPTVFEGSGSGYEPIQAQLTELLPDQTYYYRTVAQAEPAKPKRAVSETVASFHTMTPTVQVPGSPSASFVSEQSAVMAAQLNPEHAPTQFHFEYGVCETIVGCVITATPNETSSAYGLIPAIQEVSGLIPATKYSFRLFATNEHEEERGGTTVTEGGVVHGLEGHFVTASAALSLTAETSPATAITPTSALLSGIVNPAGQPATYAFELGIDQGAATQYGVVLSGSAGGAASPIPETLSVIGLQPATSYAYRIAVKSGYGSAVGATSTFTTPGVAAAIAAPPVSEMLPIPTTHFPKPKSAPKPKHKSKHTRKSKKHHRAKKRGKVRSGSGKKGK